MTENEKGKRPPKQVSADVYRALESSSGVNRSFLITFLLFEVYMLITMGLTKDLQLLVPDKGVHLPFVNMDIPIIQFYLIAPVLLLAVHFNLLMHLYQHSMKLVRWQHEVGSPDNESSALVPPFLFNYVVRYREGDASYYLLTGSLYLIIYFFPLAVLLMTQVIFSKYHNLPMTLWHFAVLFADLQFSMLYWRRIICPEKEAEGERDWKGMLKEQNKCVFLPLLKIVFLVPVWNAILLMMRFALQPKGALGDIRSKGVVRYYYDSIFGKVNVLTMFSSLVVGFSIVNVMLMISLSTGLYPKNPSFRWLYPNLNLQEADLLVNGQKGAAIDLKGRRLEFVNFKNSHMRLNAPFAALQASDLSGAEIINANFQEANLDGAYLIRSKLENANFQEAKLRIANLADAELQKANLNRANFQFANLKASNLQVADLTQADLQGSTLEAASLQGATLGAANLEGAILEAANLQGADLRYANLQGADLWSANLQGANLGAANLQGADLRSANLQGADLTLVALQGSILEKTALRGAIINDVSAKVYLGEPNFETKADWKIIINKALKVIPQTHRIDFENKLRNVVSRSRDFKENEQIRQLIAFRVKNSKELEEILSLREELACKEKYIVSGLLIQYPSVEYLINKFDEALTVNRVINDMRVYMEKTCPEVANQINWNKYLTK